MTVEDPISEWLGVDPRGGPRDAHARVSRRMWALASLPWLGVGALLVVLVAGVGRSPAPAADATRGEDAAATGEEPPLEDGSPGGEVQLESIPPPPPTEPPPGTQDMQVAAGAQAADGPIDPAVTAVALRAVHEAVTGMDAGQRADLLVVDATEQRGEVTLVGVVAVVVEGDRPDAARTSRYAVPVASAGHAPRALAAPWPVPVHGGPPEPAPWQEPDPAPDASLLAAALSDAGWTSAEVDTVREAAALGVLEVRLRGSPPGGGAVADHVVWVDAGDLRVLDPTAAATDPQPQDDERPPTAAEQEEQP